MSIPGITFKANGSDTSGLSSRADVAVFVGCIGRSRTPLPDEKRAELQNRGWTEEGLFQVSTAQLQSLLDIPVSVESWSEFETLYAWNRRPTAPESTEYVPTHLGLAVQSFFEEGGIKAYIVRTGDPLPLVDLNVDAEEFRISKRALLSWVPSAPPVDADKRRPILAGFENLGTASSATDPATWTGAALIYAIDDAAMLVLPDLIDICSGAPTPIPPVPAVPGPSEIFKPCAPLAPTLEPEERVGRPDYRAPRLDEAGYRLWAGALEEVLTLLGRPRGPAHRRDIMLISALPLPLVEAGFEQNEEQWPLGILDGLGMIAHKNASSNENGIGSARLQLGYPWIGTNASRTLPEGLQSPEGLLTGIIARTSLADGAFRSAAGRICQSPFRLYPKISKSELGRGLDEKKADWLGERICLVGERRGRFELLSDATMAHDQKWRAGGVSRLMGIVLRASRWLGNDLVFEPSGSHLWARVRSSIEAFLDGLWKLGALDGRSQTDAFEVRCDESSMTQADIDNGRIICTVGFTAAYPIQHISVSLMLLDAPSTIAPANNGREVA